MSEPATRVTSLRIGQSDKQRLARLRRAYGLTNNKLFLAGLVLLELTATDREPQRPAVVEERAA